VGYLTYAMDADDDPDDPPAPSVAAAAIPEPIVPGVVAATGPGMRPATLIIIAVGLVLLALLLLLVL
jgi:hypothetical protein